MMVRTVTQKRPDLNQAQTPHGFTWQTRQSYGLVVRITQLIPEAGVLGPSRGFEGNSSGHILWL